MHTKRLLCVAALAALALAAGLWVPGPQAPAAVQAADPTGPQQQGPYLDSMVFTAVAEPADAVAALQADELDLYAYSVRDKDLFQVVSNDPDLSYTTAFGSYNELTFNPAGPEFNDGRLNPFSNAAIRAEMNRLIDRDYIVQEIMGGLGIPKYTSLNAHYPDYDRYRTTAEAIEAEYAYNFSQAQAAIAAEMEAMGAYLQGGIWHYDGAPVTVIFLIRTEDERRQMGDYAAGQLEAAGFSVDHHYCTVYECSPLWNQSDPAAGLWNIYTGGWITTAISRDDATNFGYFYTPLGSGSPLWQSYHPTPEFQAVADALWTNDFSSMAERDALFEQALWMAMDDAGAAPPEGAGSLRVWLEDRTSFAPQRAEVIAPADLAGGVARAEVFPYEARFDGEEGGSMRIAQPGVLIEPWNAIAGSNWVYDAFPLRATQDYGLISDPATGLYNAQHVESAACVVKEGFVVNKTLDWIDLSFAPVVEVPSGAWADWDAATQTFITAADMPTPTLEANAKCTVTYPADLFDTVTWHDGSPLDAADFVMRMIMAFDVGKEESPIYNESLAPQVEAFLSHFRGVVIESTDPLVITTYDDLTYLDAEWMVIPWWPNHWQGPGSWHALAPAIRAEAAGQLAFSTGKANLLGVPWTDMISGGSLGILEGWMDQSAAEGYIPYLPTLGAYVTGAEADARWAALQAWHGEYGHFWVGTGPFYLAWANRDTPALVLGRFTGGGQPELVIDHESGAPGSYFNVTGTGFPAGRSALVSVNNTLLGSVAVDGTGQLAFTLDTGQAGLGEYLVRAGVDWMPGVPFALSSGQPEWPREGDFPVVVVPSGLIKSSVYLPIALRSFSPGLLYSDNFSDPESGWWTLDDSWATFRYVDGEYEMKFYSGGSGASSWAPTAPLPGGFSIEADVRMMSLTYARYGLMMYTSGDTAYYYVVDPLSPYYQVQFWDGDEWQELAYGTSGAIHIGTGTNHLKMAWTGSHLLLYANDQYLATVATNAYDDAWQGVFLWSNAYPVAARFDNFAVRDLPGGGLSVEPAPAEARFLRVDVLPPTR